jgi:hypothetical protein
MKSISHFNGLKVKEDLKVDFGKTFFMNLQAFYVYFSFLKASFYHLTIRQNFIIKLKFHYFIIWK